MVLLFGKDTHALNVSTKNYLCTVKSTDILLSHARTDHSAAVYGLCVTNDKKFVLSASGDRFIAEWDVQNLNPTGFAIKLTHPAYSVFAIPESDFILAGNSAGSFHVIDRGSSKETRLLSVHSHGIYSFAYLSKEKIIVVAGGDGSISLWHFPSFDLIRQIPFGEMKIRKIAVSPDESEMALACSDGNIRILDTVFFNETYTLKAHEGGAVCCVYSKSKPVLYAGGRDGFIRVFNRSKSYECILELPGHYTSIYSISLCTDEKYLITTSRDKSFKIWTLPEWEVLEKIEARHGGHAHSVNDSIWVNDRTFVTCGDDRKLLRIAIMDSPS